MPIDLSRLPAPKLVDESTFEVIRNEMLADLVDRMQVYEPEFETPLVSDPVYKQIEVAAYRELIYRQRINEAALATMLAFAEGSDLDHIGAFYEVERLVIDAGDPEALPPIDPTYETDDEYRARIQLRFESFSVAGPSGAYEYWARSADSDVKDAKAISPSPCEVTVTVLSRTGDGTADGDLLTLVEAVLSAEAKRPQGDQLTVQSATIISYAIEVELELDDGPDAGVVTAAAEAALQAYADSCHRVGKKVALAGIISAAKVDGVIDVTVVEPASNQEPDDTQAAYCTGIEVSVA